MMARAVYLDSFSGNAADLGRGQQDKKERAGKANDFLAVVARCGRQFFTHKGQVSRFDVDQRGRVWFVDAYTERRIYTHHAGRWRGFTEGGTLRGMVESLRDYIQSGEPQEFGLGPWPEWYCGGDLWGYGEHMATVRAAAAACGVKKGQ